MADANLVPTPTVPVPSGPLATLGGVWTGSGSGSYPTITDFSYNERVSLAWSPKGFFIYQQTTSHPLTGAPMHTESGYLRLLGVAGIEFVVAQPSGVVEVHTGTVVRTDADTVMLDLSPVHVVTTPAAKPVTAVRRTVTFHCDTADTGTDTLTYDVAMAAMGLPLQHHLHATLRRQPILE